MKHRGSLEIAPNLHGDEFVLGLYGVHSWGAPFFSLDVARRVERTVVGCETEQALPRSRPRRSRPRSRRTCRRSERSTTTSSTCSRTGWSWMATCRCLWLRGDGASSRNRVSHSRAGTQIRSTRSTRRRVDAEVAHPYSVRAAASHAATSVAPASQESRHRLRGSSPLAREPPLWWS